MDPPAVPLVHAPTRVLVLGATGYVGGGILRALGRSGRWRPIAASRGAARLAPACESVTCESVTCDATDTLSVQRALAGAGAVVNAVLGQAETMVAATRTICAAAAQLRLRVVHVSSMSVYGEATGRIDETAPLEAASSPYAAAKIACERVVAQHMEAGGDAVILRPGIVHGPGGEQWTGRLGRMLRQRRLGDLGPFGEGRCNLTCVDDLGEAALAALERRDAAGRAFNVADPEPLTWNRFFADFGGLIGGSPVPRIAARRLRVETKVFALPLRALERAAAQVGLPAGALPEPIPPSLLRLFGQDMTLDHRRADAGLGFARIPPGLALEAAAMWFLSTHARR